MITGAPILDKSEINQLLDEFKNQETSESRKAELAQRLLEDIMRKECPRLIARARHGEKLSGSELSLLSYNRDISVELQYLIFERQISLVREKCVPGLFEKRVFKQVARIIFKFDTNLRLYLIQGGWQVLKASLKAIARKVISSTPCWQYLMRNLPVSGRQVLYDLIPALYLYCDKKINGKCFLKTVSSSLASDVFGSMGAHLMVAIGSAMGFAYGPLKRIAGNGIGAKVGGFVFALSGEFLSKRFWQYFDGNDNENVRVEVLSGARKTLGVMEADDFKTITQKWRRMILEHHPDKHPNANENEKKQLELKFQEVQTSYIILKEAEERKGELEQSEIEILSKIQAIRLFSDYFSHYYD